jgi:tetratricopeptide (TPR) repeat protein
MTERARAILLESARASRSAELGDFASAHAENETAAGLPDYSQGVEQARESAILALAWMHDPLGARKAFAVLPATTIPAESASRASVGAMIALLSANPGAIRDEEKSVEQAFRRAGPHGGIDGNAFEIVGDRTIRPAAAWAFAQMGDILQARALIDPAPRDCYFCLRMHAKIEAAQKHWWRAEFWLREAVRQAPSLPFAYADWGEMLLQKGECDEAIGKFALANTKGPHFADPMEMWGEALMAKNRSDLALAKFEEANKYAPNWGRLHLKWGEALYYLGMKDDARKQIAIAASLDLSSSDKAALTKWLRSGR